MEFDINDIKRIRKDLNLTQKELANQANVSQSVIAKIENQSIDPSFSIAKKILETLYALSHKKEMKARDVMIRKIISVKTSTPIKDAIKIMKKHNISQIPVIDESLVGMISESIILDALIEEKHNKIGEIMSPPPPTIHPDAPLSMIKDILKYWPIVIVFEREYIGVITKTDLLGILLSK